MAAAVNTADLMKMPKDELAEETVKLANRLQTVKTKAVEAGEAAVDFVAGGAGGGAAGYWMGTIQRQIDAGTEGFDDDSKKLMGVDKDLALGVVLASLSYVKGMKKQYKGPLRQAGIGALSFYVGRKAYEHASEQPVDDDDDAIA